MPSCPPTQPQDPREVPQVEISSPPSTFPLSNSPLPDISDKEENIHHHQPLFNIFEETLDYDYNAPEVTLALSLSYDPHASEPIFPFILNDYEEAGEFATSPVVNTILSPYQPLRITSPSGLLTDRLFHHFINTLSLSLYPVEPVRNPYRKVYGSLAIECKPLMDTILFASGLHLSKLGHLENDKLKAFRMEIKSSFRDALKKGRGFWALGLTVMLSIIFDVIGTGLDSWSLKLVGCRRLLKLGLAEAKGDVETDKKCVLMQFNWMATMGRTLLVGIEPLESLEEIKCIDGDEVCETSPGTIDMSFHQSYWWANMPDWKMHMLLRESTDLAVKIHKLRVTGSSTDQLLSATLNVAELLDKIKNWHPDMSSVSPEYIHSVHHFNEIWRLGLLCYIYHDIYALSSDDCRIQEALEKSLDSLQNLSWLQACMWPVFMLAVHAKTVESRDIYRDGLMRMHTSLGFQAPLSLVLVLNRVWDCLDEKGWRPWKNVVKELGLELNILL
ncbi:unnamed protein product [Clonostachys byssicola]|uniref:Uncharacterized protein n=1 Tax=Clonostachys byssicola TaxID=160290 RepID=A0A9N9UE86_9HYPO|nr:unnamed protein product [Clonostachys byssicola]